MPQTIVNFALPIVAERIDEILAGYPFYPHQQAFSASERRQKLAAYVLSRIPGYYVTMDQAAACSLESPRNCYTAEQHQQIERLIHQGIEHLLTQAETWEPYSDDYLLTDSSSQPSAKADATMAPSSWFG